MYQQHSGIKDFILNSTTWFHQHIYRVSSMHIYYCVHGPSDHVQSSPIQSGLNSYTFALLSLPGQGVYVWSGVQVWPALPLMECGHWWGEYSCKPHIKMHLTTLHFIRKERQNVKAKTMLMYSKATLMYQQHSWTHHITIQYYIGPLQM